MRPETLKERQSVSFVTTTTINAGSTAACYTGGINMGTGPRRIRAFFILGTLTSTASVNISLQSSATVSGSYANITQAGATNLTTSPVVTAITTDDSLNCLEISSDLLPTGQPFVRAYAVETASQNAVVSIVLVADDSEYKPGSAFNNATITNNVVAAV